jgi:heme exporter protein B
VDRAAIYFGKVIANLIFMFVVELIMLPIHSILFNVNLFHPGLLLVIFLGSVGYIVVGTLLSTMAVQARTRDILLPILLFPVVLPIVITAVQASAFFLQGQPWERIWPNLSLLIAFDVIFIGLAYMVFDYVVEE